MVSLRRPGSAQETDRRELLREWVAEAMPEVLAEMGRLRLRIKFLQWDIQDEEAATTTRGA